jgi:hypothetical protein
MRAAARSCALLGLALAIAACGESPRETANNAAVTDIEALPADESATTTTGDLANGAIEPANADAAQPEGNE